MLRTTLRPQVAAYFESPEDGTYVDLRAKGCTAVRRGSVAAVRGARSAVDRSHTEGFFFRTFQASS